MTKISKYTKISNSQKFTKIVNLIFSYSKDEILANYDIEYAEEDMLQLKPYDFEDPRTDEEIQGGVINATILSTFCSKEEKTDLSFHLHKIYSQYPDSLLRQVMTHLRKSKMVSSKKGNKRLQKDDGKEVQPISIIPFHLSVSFKHKFISKFQADLYKSIDKFIKKIITSSSDNSDKVILFDDLFCLIFFSMCVSAK